MITRILERLGEWKLGIIGIVVTALVSVGIGVISLVPFGQRHYTAELRHTAGLRVGEEVQIAGIGVGEVREIRLAGRHVEVAFTADEDVTLGSATNAAVKVGTLLGNHYLELVPAGGGSLPNDTVSLSHTSVPFNLQDVLEGSTNTLNRLDSETVAESLTVVADAMDYSPEQTRAAIDGVSRLARVAAEQSDQMQALLDSSADVTGLLADNSAGLIDLMKHSTVVLEELTDRRKVIRAMLRDSRRLATTITAVLDENAAELDPLMRDFTSALRNLREQEQQITASISGLATLSHYLSNASGSGPYLDLHVPVIITDSQACTTGCE